MSHDNILTSLDLRNLGDGGPEPMTPEGALALRQQPFYCPVDPEELIDLPASQRRRHIRLAKLAQEYLVDFDLVRACARAGVDWDLIRTAERDPIFIMMVRDLLDCMPPEAVITRAEILQMLKREACTAGKASDRINAIAQLARLGGMELGDGKDASKQAPTINITLNGVPAAERPTINVTPTPAQLL